MSVIPQNAMDILKANGLAHIATLGPKGEPQSTPVWFDWDGNYIRFSQTKGRQKYRNVQRDKRIALSITDPQNPYHYLEVRGEVDHIEEDPRKSFIDLLAKKYMGVDQYPYNQPGEERVIVYVKPEHTTTQQLKVWSGTYEQYKQEYHSLRSLLPGAGIVQRFDRRSIKLEFNGLHQIADLLDRRGAGDGCSNIWARHQPGKVVNKLKHGSYTILVKNEFFEQKACFP